MVPEPSKKLGKWIYIPVVLLGIYLIYRLIDQSQMMWQFPLELTNDYASHISQLHFLERYGFHAMVPEWYNGFKLFLYYPPAWYFFALPLYKILGNILVATYSSVILMLLINLGIIFYFGKKDNLSFTKSLAFYMLMFGNALAISNYIRLGRVSELFALTMFVMGGCLALYYRNKEISISGHILLSIIWGIMIFSHPSTAIAFGAIILGLVLTRKSIKAIIKLGLSLAGSLLISAFWWYPFITNLNDSLVRSEFTATLRLLDFQYWAWDSIATFIIIPILFGLFYLYYNQTKDNSQKILFFIPIMVIEFLVITRLIVFLPLFNKTYPDTYLLIAVFFSLYFLMKLPIENLAKNIRTLIIVGIVISPFASIAIAEIHTPKFQHYTQFEYDSIDVLSHAKGRIYAFGDTPLSSHPPVYQAYAAVYLNISSAGGANNYGTMSKEYYDILLGMTSHLNNKNCVGIERGIEYLKLDELITFSKHCNTLAGCGLIREYSKGEACLYKKSS